jgi:lipopolysaccharide export system protein LptA
MRGTRWLILVAIAAILGGVATTYRRQKTALEQQAPPKPKALPLDLASSAEDWHHTQYFPGTSNPSVEIWAHRLGQSKDNSRIDLENVELHIFHQESGQYDRVKSARAQFSPADQRLYSEGEVEITLAVPAQGQPRRGLVSIRSSGVTFDTTTGKASTERPADFVFDNGNGKSVGAYYDPNSNELRMLSAVELNWKNPGPRSVPMKLEAGTLSYQEKDSKIWLVPWARLTRQQSVIESGPAVVTLEEGVISKIEAQKAHGTDRYPGRALEYSAAGLWLDFAEDGTVQKALGRPDARLVSTSANTVTTVTAEQVDLYFVASDGESTLAKAVATGNGVVEARPLPDAGKPLPETRLLRSSVIEVKMRPGGREIDGLETPGRGSLEFLPNRPDQHHRTLVGDRLSIAYGPDNQIRSFRSVNVETRTDPTAEGRRHNRDVAVTRSRSLQADFTPQTGQLAEVQQQDNFTYQEGERRAVAAKATMDQSLNLLTLDTHARMWDATGSTSADRIRVDQRTGDLTATGHVDSSRLPDQKQPGSQMLSGDQPLQAMADHMTSTKGNRLIRYEGGVVLWQGSNRIQADRVEIDRENRRLTAAGRVLTQFLEETKSSQPSSPVFTVVRSARLVYTEADRLAWYTGGARMTRPGLDVKAEEIRAWLSPQGSDSRVEKAWADGKVEIAQSSPQRTRTGIGDHAEYYTVEQKVILRGGRPQLTDSKSGSVRGDELTYWANDDRLQVNGAASSPATSLIRRK